MAKARRAGGRARGRARSAWSCSARSAARGDHLIEKLFRDVKAMDIVEGTGQIQRIVIARQLVGLPRDAGAA